MASLDYTTVGLRRRAGIRHCEPVSPRTPVLVSAAIGLSSLAAGAAGLLADEPVLAIGAIGVGAILGGLATYWQFHASPALPPGPPPSPPPAGVTVWNLPRPTASFAGRDADLADLDTKLAEGSGSVAMVAVHGLGGMGKTQLALRFAASLAAAGSVTVGWQVNAASREYALDSLAQLGRGLGLPEADDANRAAEEALAALGRRRGWVLVYDDATRPDDLRGLLPVAGSGRVIVTSRHADWRGAVRPLRLDPLDVPDAVEFLLARTGDGDRVAATTLAQRLAGLPLALEQAAAYCETTGMPMASYLRRYESAPLRLLTEGHPQDHPEPVARTWLVSMAEARRRNRAAVDLLSLLAYVAPVPLPRDVLGAAPSTLPRRLRRVVADDLALDAAVRVLHGLSLATAQGDTIHLHALVQEVVRDRIRRAAGGWRRWTEGRWIAAAVAMLTEAFPTGRHTADRWPLCAALRPHVEAAVDNAKRTGADPLATATLEFTLSYYLSDRAEYGAARALLEGVIATRRRLLGDEAAATLVAMNNLAVLLRDQGDLVGSRNLLEQILTVGRRVLGEEHPDLLASMNNLALVLHAQGDLVQAQDLHEQTLTARRQLFGEEHPDTLASMNNLALVLRSQGDLTGARELHEQELATCRRILGDDHPDTLASMNNLALVLHAQGDLAGARELHELELATSRRVLGEEHPDTLTSMNNLAEVLRDQEDLTGARELHEQALAIRSRVLGNDHPETLTSMNNLAEVFRGQGDLTGARDMHLRNLATSRRVLGDGHPDTLTAMSNLAEVLEALGDDTASAALRDEADRHQTSGFVAGQDWLIQLVTSAANQGAGVPDELTDTLDSLRASEAWTDAFPAVVERIVADPGTRPDLDGLDELEIALVEAILDRLGDPA